MYPYGYMFVNVMRADLWCRTDRLFTRSRRAEKKQKRPHDAGVFALQREPVYSAAGAAAPPLALRAGSFSLIRADLPERSRR